MLRFAVGNLLYRVSLLGLLLLGPMACTKSGIGGSDTPSFSSPLESNTLSPLSHQDSPPTAVVLPPLTLEPDYGGAKGRIADYPADWSGQQLYVFFSPFYADTQTEGGFYILDPSIHPSTQATPGGDFQLGNIPPGKYVVVVGPDPRESIPISDGDRQRIFEITDGKILQIGDVSIRK